MLQENDFLVPNITDDEAVYLKYIYNHTVINNHCPKELIHEGVFCDVIYNSYVHPMWLAKIIYGYAIPAVNFIGFIANTLVVITLKNKNLRTPTNYILRWMAMSELLTGISTMPWLIYYYTLNGYEDEENLGLSPFWCKFHSYFNYILPTLFHTTAIWLTVYLAISRYMYVCMPSSVQQYCSIKITKRIVWLIFIFGFLSLTPSFFIENNLPFEYHSGRHLCLRNVPTFIYQVIGILKYDTAAFFLRVFFVHIIPCILVTIFTAKLFVTIKKADRKRSTSMPTAMKKLSTYSQASGNLSNALLVNFPNTRGQTKLLHSTTKMLLVVIGIFLIIESPVAILYVSNILIVLIQIDNNDFLKHVSSFMIIRNFLIVLTYPFNFAIYFWMSAQFKAQFKAQFQHMFGLQNEPFIQTTNTENTGCFSKFPIQLVSIHKNGEEQGIRILQSNEVMNIISNPSAGVKYGNSLKVEEFGV
uniref:G_PROTEIN_RECEP_F1_2 domain-containing protein n=1 Tax=Rhabditophanes sp. KR3021 TaxID=114890 RepID=A0AC35U5U5_9BILA